MWHCSYCPHTSSRKWNMYVHEKRKHVAQTENLDIGIKNNQLNNIVQTQGKPKHSTQTQTENNVSNVLKNDQINNKDVKVEDVPLWDSGHASVKENILVSETEKEMDYIRYVPQLKKMKYWKKYALRMEKKLNIIQDCSRRLSKINKELEKIEAPKRRMIDWLGD